ncbi:MAG: hypothetical protein IPM29_30325 [Planctomycetes bacterium]|nr:hypothetical protein [Planctomycetota bacterium]
MPVSSRSVIAVVGALLSSALLAGGLLAGGLAAQQSLAPRARAFGVALRADGSPWCGATVRLTHRPFAWSPQGGELERIEVLTDDSGAFRADLQVDLTYRVFAFEVLPDGRHLIAAGVLPLRARQRVEVRASPHAIDPHTRLTGIPPEVARPLRARVVHTDECCVVEEVPIGDGGTLAIPPATRAAELQVDAADGERLVTATVEVARLGPELAVPDAVFASLDIEPAAAQATAELVAPEHGGWRPVARCSTTGPTVISTRGSLTVVDGSVRRRIDWTTFGVRAPGHDLARTRLRGRPRVPARSAAEALARSPTDRMCTLSEVGDPDVVFLTVGDTPLADATICGERDQTGALLQSSLLHTDQHGALDAAAFRVRNRTWNLAVDAALLAGVPPAWRGALGGVVQVRGVPDAGQATDLLEQIRPVRIGLQPVENTRLGDPRVSCAAPWHWTLPVRTATDAEVGITVVMPRGATEIQVLDPEAGWASVRIRPTHGPDCDQPLELRLELQAFAAFTVWATLPQELRERNDVTVRFHAEPMLAAPGMRVRPFQLRQASGAPQPGVELLDDATDLLDSAREAGLCVATGPAGRHVPLRVLPVLGGWRIRATAQDQHGNPLGTSASEIVDLDDARPVDLRITTR